MRVLAIYTPSGRPCIQNSVPTLCGAGFRGIAVWSHKKIPAWDGCWRGCGILGALEGVDSTRRNPGSLRLYPVFQSRRFVSRRQYLSFGAYKICHGLVCRSFHGFSDASWETNQEGPWRGVPEVEEEVLPGPPTMVPFHILGTSKCALRLRKTINLMSQDYPHDPVLIQGEYGCMKDEISELIHNMSGRRVFEVNDCALMIPGELVQRIKDSKYCKDLHTMLIRNVHLCPDDIKNFLCVYQNDDNLRDTMKIIMTSDVELGSMDHVIVVKVLPLRARLEDVTALAMYFLDKISFQRGIRLLKISPSAMRRLETFSYPENELDLENMLHRAVSKHLQELGAPAFLQPGASAIMLQTDDLQGYYGDEHPFSLSERFPGLKPFLMSPWWPKVFNQKVTVHAFAVTVLYLFIGPQTRDKNPILAIFWDTWWPLSFLLFPLVGRVWCSVCPFQAYGELAQNIKLKFGGNLSKWPRNFLEQWGNKFMVVSFTAILIWEQVWDLPNNGTLSAYLLLLITFGAVVGQFFFEKRIFCRYLCPIGGMNGLFTQLSMTRMKGTQGICSAECSTYACLKGSDYGSGGAGKSTGCPMQTHPAQAVDNRLCVLCMECIKGCPNDSVHFLLQIPGRNIWDGVNHPIPEELAIGFVLLGAMMLHGLPSLLADFGLSEYEDLIYHSKVVYVIISIIIIALPGIMAFSSDALWRLLADKTEIIIGKKIVSVDNIPDTSMDIDFDPEVVDTSMSTSKGMSQQGSKRLFVAPQAPFLRLGYGYLPLMWSSVLAYYMKPLMYEGGHIPGVLGSALGIAGARDWAMWSFSSPEIHLIQSMLLQFGIIASLVLSRKISGQPWKFIIPQCLCIISIGAELHHMFLSM